MTILIIAIGLLALSILLNVALVVSTVEYVKEIDELRGRILRLARQIQEDEDISAREFVANFTLVELRAFAKTNEINLHGKRRKADIAKIVVKALDAQ